MAQRLRSASPRSGGGHRRLDEAGPDGVDPDVVPGQLLGQTLGGHPHPRLAHAVGAARRRHLRHDRAEVDQAAAPPVGHHPARDGAVGVQHAVEVHVDHRAEAVGRDVEHRVGLGGRGIRSCARYPGGGHQHVHRAEGLHARRDHRLVRRLVGGVGPQRERLAAGGLHLPRGLGRRALVEVGGAHLRAFRREAERARAADAAAGAGDQGDLVVEPSGHVRSPCVGGAFTRAPSPCPLP